jgi:hypothetical protein
VVPPSFTPLQPLAWPVTHNIFMLCFDDVKNLFFQFYFQLKEFTVHNLSEKLTVAQMNKKLSTFTELQDSLVFMQACSVHSWQNQSGN